MPVEGFREQTLPDVHSRFGWPEPAPCIRPKVVYDHIGLKVKSLDASVRFYRAALGVLGHVLHSQEETSASFGPPGEPGFWLYLATSPVGPGIHIAFRAPERSAVDRFYKFGLEAGGRDHGAPGVRADYGAHYYAAFLIDPDDNNVEAVCLR
jgi:catechol 2,3-dioxygenase-like lactoylglutathione lyase family enzyme